VLTEIQERIRELRADCARRRDWIRAEESIGYNGSWRGDPNAIADWRGEIAATQASIKRLVTGDYPEGTPINFV
jgi:hypothetical protein